MSRVFVDTSALLRYFADDDPPRAVAAARLFDSDTALVASTTALLALVHVLRTRYRVANHALGEGVIAYRQPRHKGLHRSHAYSGASPAWRFP